MKYRVLLALAALCCIAMGLWGLESPRTGLAITSDRVGNTPVTVMRQPEADGPVVIIAHGFAGSRQLMAGWQLSLAQAGFITVTFDFEGHGRNPVPMSGDVTAIDGTTRLLMQEIGRVTDYALALPGAEPRVALVGHSMASDIVVRQGLADDRVGAIIGISVFSQAITADTPENLLMVNGAWEGALREEARRIMAELGAEEGQTVGTPGEGFARRAVAVPRAEHVSVLYATPGMTDAINWLSDSFGVAARGSAVSLGPWILLTLFGVVLLALPLARLVPEGPSPWHPSTRQFLLLALLPAIATPLALAPFDTRLLPVLVADYLALHLALYGLLILGAVRLMGAALPSFRQWPLGLALAAFGILVFGGIMDRYVGSFLPVADRIPVMLAILPGAVLAMLADATLSEATRAPLWRRIVARGAFLISLGIAVALDFERLFFLVIILPVVLLFYLSYGMMGRFVGKRTGSVVAMGLGLGLILGWALGVTFPMFDPTLQ